MLMEHMALTLNLLFIRKAEGPSKCINKTCVAPAAPKAEIPSEYVKTRNGDLYYLSQEENVFPEKDIWLNSMVISQPS